MPRMNYYNGTSWVRACKSRLVGSEPQDMDSYEVGVFKNDEYVYGAKNTIETNAGETSNTSYYSFAYIDCQASGGTQITALCVNAIADLLCNNCGFTFVSYANIYAVSSLTNYARISKGNFWFTIFYNLSEYRIDISTIGYLGALNQYGSMYNKFSFYTVGSNTRVHIKFFTTKNGGTFVINMYSATQGRFIFHDFNCTNIMNSVYTSQYCVKVYTNFLMDDIIIPNTISQMGDVLHGKLHPQTDYTSYAKSQTNYFMSKLFLISVDNYIASQAYYDAHRDYYRYYAYSVYFGAYTGHYDDYELFTIGSRKFVRLSNVILELN